SRSRGGSYRLDHRCPKGPPAEAATVTRVGGLSELRDLLGTTADLAADFYDSLSHRAVYPPASAEELRAALGGPVPQEPSDAREVVGRLAEGGGSAPRRFRGRPLLRLRDRRLGAGRARRRLACHGVGPE